MSKKLKLLMFLTLIISSTFSFNLTLHAESDYNFEFSTINEVDISTYATVIVKYRQDLPDYIWHSIYKNGIQYSGYLKYRKYFYSNGVKYAVYKGKHVAP